MSNTPADSSVPSAAQPEPQQPAHTQPSSAEKPQYREEKPLPLLNALRNGAIGLAVVLLLGVIVGWFVAGLAGVWGALLGGLIAGVFELITVVMVLVTRNLPPATTMGIIMGSWLLKILLALVVVASIKGLTFYDRETFVAVMTVALVVVLTAETLGVKKTQATYVTPFSKED